MFEYLQYDFTLAVETRMAFELAKKTHLLSGNLVKTNFYYLITNGEYDLYPNIGKLDQSFQKEFYDNAFKWTKNLIEILKPAIIICEGKKVFDHIMEIYPSPVIEKNCPDCFLSTCDAYPFKVIGYSRRRSYIKNKHGLSELINQVM